MYSSGVFVSFASLLAFTTFVYAGFDPASSSNIAIYWGQNSHNQGSGPFAQQRLAYYCANSELNVIQLAFLVTIANPELNFANAGDNCTLFAGTKLFNCPQITEDIAACQNTYHKTILLSIGGSTYTEGGFADYTSAVKAANNLWAIFGPEIAGSSINRPFGSSVVDGFDFDFESSVSNSVPFANQLRSLMDADSAKTGKNWFLTVAPQCPYPDAADNDMLNGQVFFNAIWVQFYNNYCGLQSFLLGPDATQNNFNFHAWDSWAKTVSKNPAVKVLLGVPGSPTAAGSGYETGSTLASIIQYCQMFSSFGGVMSWDMSQIYANPGFLDGVYSDLASTVTITTPTSTSSVQSTITTTSTSTSTSTVQSTVTTTLTSVCLVVTTTVTTSAVITVTTTASPLTVITVTATTSSATTTTSTGPGTVPQWSQCGGVGYTGPTQCVSPYSCVQLSVWWSQCE